jgi:hypothetical protein
MNVGFIYFFADRKSDYARIDKNSMHNILLKNEVLRHKKYDRHKYENPNLNPSILGVGWGGEGG